MKKLWLVALVLQSFALSLVPLGAQNVAEDVLKKADLASIKFQNYVGPHQVIETREAIQSIGADLGRQMKADSTKPADFSQKYSVVRVYDAKDPKLSADVFILAPGAGVDDIRNLNWIVSNYLQQSFGYKADAADLVADFITRYNAVYRGNLAYFQQTYVKALGNQVTAANVGIALNYAEWPGKTRLVIPLRDTLSAGPAGLVNAEEVSNPAVVDKLKGEPQGLDQRKKITDLKEGEIVQEQKAITQKQQDIAQQQKALDQTKAASATPSATPAATPATSPATTPATAPAAKPATTPAATQPGAATPSATTPAATPAATPAKTPAEIAADQKKIDDDKAAVAKAQAANAQRDQALQTDRKAIVQDQKAADATPAAAPIKAPTSTNSFVRVTEATGFGQLILVDPQTNSVWKKSDVNTIRHAVAQDFASAWLVTAGDTKGNAAVRLLLLGKDALDIKVTGKEDASPDGPVLISGQQFYAVIKGDKGQWILGLFDAKLNNLQKSTETVQPNTGLTVTPQGILVQGTGGKLILLDTQTLKKKSDTTEG